MRVSVATLVSENYPDEILEYQSRVINLFCPEEYDFVQVRDLSCDRHARKKQFCKCHHRWIDQWLKDNLEKYDVFLFIDADCIPLNKDILPSMVDTASKDILVGVAQRRQVSEAKDYVAPACAAISGNLWIKLGKPRAKMNRGDTIEEWSIRCRERGLPLELLYPTGMESPKWRYEQAGGLGKGIGDYFRKHGKVLGRQKKYFGKGVTYEDSIYHMFESRNLLGKSLENNPFINKCKQVIANHSQ